MVLSPAAMTVPCMMSEISWVLFNRISNDIAHADAFNPPLAACEYVPCCLHLMYACYNFFTCPPLAIAVLLPFSRPFAKSVPHYCFPYLPMCSSALIAALPWFPSVVHYTACLLPHFSLVTFVAFSTHIHTRPGGALSDKLPHTCWILLPPCSNCAPGPLTKKTTRVSQKGPPVPVRLQRCRALIPVLGKG